MTAKKETVFQGIPASPGIAIGEVLLVGSFQATFTEPANRNIDASLTAKEVERFRQALDQTRHEIRTMQKRLQHELDAREASIFDAHLLIVDDQMLLNEAIFMISNHCLSAEYAFYKTINRYVTAISTMEDSYIRERVDDIKDVACRILSFLGGDIKSQMEHLPGKRIIAAHDLTPSATVLMDRVNVMAFAVETGSQTSHTAILARSMKIPAIVGLHQLCESLKNGDKVIVDGYVGSLILHPSESTVKLYQQKEYVEEKLYSDLVHESRLRPETQDGFSIQLAANVDSQEDLRTAVKFGAAGIGLFRTEYLFVHRERLPSEEEQFATYRDMLAGMPGRPVTIRTIDAGGDKLADTIASLSEPNPFLGLRAIRLCLREQPQLLRTQLRAMLRASHFGQLKIMFPMISCTDEVAQLLELFKDVQAELNREKIPFNPQTETGIMIETPAAALQAEQLAEMVDFFSIGSNDLIQYTMAVDRSNDKVAYLYQPTHPAVVELIRRTVDAARSHNIWVSMCGEMAGNPLYLPLLLGSGINELSMSPVYLGNIRRTVRKLSMHEAEDTLQTALRCRNSTEILDLCKKLLEKRAPEILEMSIKGI